MNINLNPVDGACIILGHVFRDIDPRGMGRIIGANFADNLKPFDDSSSVILYRAENGVLSKMNFLCHEIREVEKNTPIYHDLFWSQWDPEVLFDGSPSDIAAFKVGFFEAVKNGIKEKSRSFFFEQAKRAKEAEEERMSIENRKNQPHGKWGDWQTYPGLDIVGSVVKNFQILGYAGRNYFLKIKIKGGMLLIGDIHSFDRWTSFVAQAVGRPDQPIGKIISAEFERRERPLYGSCGMVRQTFLHLTGDEGFVQFRWTQKFECEPDDPECPLTENLIQVCKLTKHLNSKKG